MLSSSHDSEAPSRCPASRAGRTSIAKFRRRVRSRSFDILLIRFSANPCQRPRCQHCQSTSSALVEERSTESQRALQIVPAPQQTDFMVTSMALRVVPELIVFDCDGVVADSETLANQLLAESISRIGRPTTLEDSIRLFMGKRWEDCKLAIIDWTGEPLPPSFEADHRALSRGRMRSEVGSVPGLEAFLMAHRSFRKCVASSSEHTWLNHCVDKFGLRPHFGLNLFSATEVANGKPAPDVFLYAARRMGVSPEACLVLEDSPSGITGAVAAGMTAVGFLGGSHVLDGHAEQLRLAGAHYLARNFAEVAHLLAGR
jgi:HAD superfamily hydrolase (TIGR01509 family)